MGGIGVSLLIPVTLMPLPATTRQAIATATIRRETKADRFRFVARLSKGLTFISLVLAEGLLQPPSLPLPVPPPVNRRALTT
jgi:hypothetical protein